MRERQSNIELLRIIAMLLVVLVHANFLTLGVITQEDVVDQPLLSFSRLLFEQICIIGVDVFVLISGWFGIRPTLKGGCGLLFQPFFYGCLIILLALAINIPIDNPKNCIKALCGGWYWFVVEYLILYVVSPILNSFIEKTSSKEILAVILVFFFVQIVFGWISRSGQYAGGYSAISFIGLYLLSRYVNKYSVKIKHLKASTDFLAYAICTIIPVCLAFFGLKYWGKSFGSISYLSPFVIAASLFCLLGFQKVRLQSNSINWIGCSVFAIFLVHTHPIVVPYFRALFVDAFGRYNWAIYVLFAVAVALIIGVVCVLLDKIRILLWRFLCEAFLDKFFTRIESSVNEMSQRYS